MGIPRSDAQRTGTALVAANSAEFREIELPETEIDRIQRLIVTERFATLFGDQVSVGDLCQRNTAGRSIILEALAPMQEEGLVEKSAGHGWIVRPALTDEDACQESYRFRLLVELAVFLEPGFSVPCASLDELLAT